MQQSGKCHLRACLRPAGGRLLLLFLHCNVCPLLLLGPLLVWLLLLCRRKPLLLLRLLMRPLPLRRGG